MRRNTGDVRQPGGCRPEARDVRQETKDKKHETGDVRQETCHMRCKIGDGRQETGDSRWETGVGTEDRTEEWRPETGDDTLTSYPENFALLI